MIGATKIGLVAILVGALLGGGCSQTPVISPEAPKASTTTTRNPGAEYRHQQQLEMERLCREHYERDKRARIMTEEDRIMLEKYYESPESQRIQGIYQGVERMLRELDELNGTMGK